MRITSGTFRGRNLASPNSELTHPMGDREKLALFNPSVIRLKTWWFLICLLAPEP